MAIETVQPSTAHQVKRDLASLADPERAKNLAWFFKTGKGEYAEGDRFLGVTVPMQRKIARQYSGLALSDIVKLLSSPIHEHRLTALLILSGQYLRASEEEREEIFGFYLRHTSCVNNWDLVDSSASYIVGQHLKSRPRGLLYDLAKSQNLWERRIAIVATFAFMKDGQIEDTYRVAELLLPDKHDLIHKALGWALRETGKVSRSQLLGFLQRHYNAVPRTALRYAIEHFSAEERKQMLKGVFPVSEESPR